MSYRYGCGYGVGAGPSRTPEVIWDARLDILPLSTTANAAELRAALLAMGLTLTRASTATVQTSASEVVTSGIGVDDPRVGLYGLVIEESRQSVFWNSMSLSSNIEAGVVVAAPTASTGAAGPDGSTASRRLAYPSVPSAGNASVSYRSATGTAASWSISAWVRGVAGGEQAYLSSTPDGVTFIETSTGTVTTAWSRVSKTGTMTAVPWYTQVGTDRRSAGQSATPAQSIDVAGMQVELGKFPTELILTTGAAATRAAENLTLAPNVSRSGFLALEWKLVSKAATGSYSVNTVPLWTGPNGDYIGFHGVNRSVLLYLGGVVYSSAAGAISWAAGDVVEIFVSCGGGAAAVFKYRVNGGAVTTVVIASGGATPVLPTYASGGVLLQSGSASCWLQRVRAYAPGRRPAWAA